MEHLGTEGLGQADLGADLSLSSLLDRLDLAVARCMTAAERIASRELRAPGLEAEVRRAIAELDMLLGHPHG